jgi:preprotein translocase subunit YajC
MNEKHIKDLTPGDRVELMEGDIATIVKVVRSGIIEVAGDTAYDVTYRHAEGETTMHALAGRNLVATAGALQ